MTATPSAHVAALHLPAVRPRRYGVFTRIADGYNGRRDAKGQLAYASDDRQPTHSLARLKADCDEQCEREYRAALTTAVELCDYANFLDEKIEDAEKQITELDHRFDTAAATAFAVPDVAHRSERHLSSEVIARRRHVEAEARLAPLRAQLHVLRDQAARDRTKRVEVRGQLATLWDGLKSRVLAISDYFERRAVTQSRAYLRRTPPKTGGDHPLLTRALITAPEWAYGPNPWLPVVTVTTPGKESSRD